MKLLHLPNDPSYEDIPNRQNGSRDAFERLHREGALSDYEAFSFLADYRKTRDYAGVCKEILRRTSAMKPDIIFWHHIAEFPVDKTFIDQLRDASHGALLAYHEGDPYDTFIKKVFPQLRVILSNADVVFSIALGDNARTFRKNGAKDIRFLPHVYDTARFGAPWDYTERREFKVSMIARRWSFVHGLFVSGVAERARLARELTANYGTDFALYGAKWKDLKSMRGPVRFDLQTAAIRNSWVSANWDHYDNLDFYFSDRLPISLAAGVPHVTSYHAGYEDVLAGCPGLYSARSVDEALAKVDWVLSHTRKQLVEIGRAAHEWVKTRLDGYVVFRQAYDICLEKLADR